MKKIIQKIVLGAVIVKDRKVLILQRHENEETYPGMWELPSGKKENFESSEASLVREVREESGLDIEVIMPVSVFDYQIDKPDEICDSTQINFLITVINNKDVVLSDEHQAYTWITDEQIDEYNITNDTKDVIRKAFEIISKLNLEVF